MNTKSILAWLGGMASVCVIAATLGGMFAGPIKSYLLDGLQDQIIQLHDWNVNLQKHVDAEQKEIDRLRDRRHR